MSATAISTPSATSQDVETHDQRRQRLRQLLRSRAALVEELDGLGCPAEAAAEAREKWQLLREHVQKKRHRTDYPAYRARGWDVGSGPTEAGCKVIGKRVKSGGMRWLQGCSVEVAALKALYASGMGLWDAFWRLRRPGHGCLADQRI